MTEVLDGALRFNGWLFVINIAMFIAFLYQWYRFYKETGINLDIWHYNLLLIYVIPFILMYPFAASELNIFSVGTDPMVIIQANLNEAYVITLVGFISIFLGKYYFDNFGINTLVNSIFYIPFKITIGKYYKRVVLNTKVSRGLGIVYILILILFVNFTVSQGFANNPRAFFMANPQFRPFYNFTISLFSITFGILTTRILQFDKQFDKWLLVPIVLLGFFLGVRSPLIFQGLGFGVLYVIYRRKGYISLYKMLLVVLVTLSVVVALVFVRNSDSSTFNDRSATAIFLYEIFYGNTFSDIRDFSWVIGYWNGEHLWGLSYISAFLSFIPSFLLPFREKWGIGKVTVNLVGFDPTIHPGLRPGFFGEMYLNFDVIGVIILGFVWGQVNRKVNSIVNTSVKNNDVILGNSALTAAGFVSFLSNSAGFFGFYVNFLALFILYLLTRVKFIR